MIRVSSSGSFSNLDKLFSVSKNNPVLKNLDVYGQMGVQELIRATPVDSGLAANSWGYRIIQTARGPKIEWYNTDIEGGENVAILLQYDHQTKNGGLVLGRDYINPAIQVVVDRVKADLERQVR